MVWGDLDTTLDCLPPLFIVLTSLSKSSVYVCKEQEVKLNLFLYRIKKNIHPL